MSVPNNQYWNLDNDGVAEPIDVFAPKTYARGTDYYIDIFRIIEDATELEGLTFFLSELPPKSLPRLGKDVVLIVVSDEAFQARWYFPDLCAVIRTYSDLPSYGYGLPLHECQRSALVQYIYKNVQAQASRLKSSAQRRDLAMISQPRRMLHTPLGTFFRFSPDLRPITQRPTNFAFLGSVEYGQGHRRWQHNLLRPPKLASRADLIAGIEAYAIRHGDRGTVQTTGDFEESIKNQSGYARALQDCKISLCPRGSNAETYRFFESCKAGCVVICEPLPEAWFYQQNPALVLRDWRQLPALLQKLLADPERMQRLSDQTRSYWENSLSEVAIAKRMTSFLRPLLLKA